MSIINKLAQEQQESTDLQHSSQFPKPHNERQKLRDVGSVWLISKASFLTCEYQLDCLNLSLSSILETC